VCYYELQDARFGLLSEHISGLQTFRGSCHGLNPQVGKAAPEHKSEGILLVTRLVGVLYHDRFLGK
jgi:hypothetical protein